MPFFFDGNEDPKQREMRLRQMQMDKAQAGAMETPQNVGQGLSAIADAFAYRALKNRQQQAAADPWTGMRQTTASPFSGFGKALTGLFGLGAR